MQLYQSGFSFSFDGLVISCPKSVFSIQFVFVDQMKKHPKFALLLQPPHFTIYSLIVIPYNIYIYILYEIGVAVQSWL